jgi:signal transduction histidine kinase
MLLFMVLVSVLPALAIILHYGVVMRDRAFDLAADETSRLAHGASMVQQRATEGTRQILYTLSLMPAVQRLDVLTCSRILQEIIRGNPFYTNLALTDPSGEVLATALPFKDTNLADRRHILAALHQQRFATGEYIIARTTNAPAFAFAHPVLGSAGEVVGVLTAAIDLDRFGEFFRARRMPPEAFLGIADHKGRRLYRTLTSSTFSLGEPISPPVWESVQAGGDSGTFIRTGSDGRSWVMAYEKLYIDDEEEPYMTFFVGVPEEVVAAGASRPLEVSLWLLAGAAALALAVAMTVERVVFMPKVRALVLAAERFRVGDYDRLTGVDYGAGELGLLADAMDRMAVETRGALESLRQARDEAQEASRAKSEFLAGMSHDIRTPLNGVTGMLHLLRTTGTDEEQAGYIDTALRSSERLAELLMDILDLSRIESSRLTLNREVFSVADMEQSIRDVFTVQARDKGLRLEVRTDPRIPPYLLGDEERLRRILFNLIGNAVKFTAQGSVTVRFDLVSALGEEPCRIAFTVKDTGVGIPPERLKEAFEPFTQLGGGKAARAGAGLGLAIVSRLVRLMEGELSMESAPGRGTVAVATLPFTPAEEPAREPEAPRRGPTECRGTRVLLVEDDPINRMAMKAFLGKLGCEVVEAGDGKEAVELLRREGVDLVFMDVQMPVMDGLEATRVIREELGLSVPVVAITAYAMAGDRERFLAQGMNDYVAKPAGPDELSRVLERWGRAGLAAV